VKGRLLRLGLALLPLGGGLAVSLVLHLGFPEVPLLVFKADLGSALAVAGGLLSMILLAGSLGWAVESRSALARLEEMHRLEEDSRRRFLRRLDHELKNPLTGLRAALANLGAIIEEDYLAQTRPTGSAHFTVDPLAPRSLPETNRALADAQLQIERLSRLVADLRKLAELEERPLETMQVDMVEVLEETVEAVRSLPAYAGRDVRISIPRVPWPIPPVPGDRDLLGLAFYNLVENALKYSRPQDTVEVRAVEDGRRLLVEVADNGPGISAEDLPRVFEELYRGSNARGLEGSGLGLALVRRVIERHGGEISVRSRQGQPRGTVFRAALPVK
jgi:two-component system OmpR family sensor kinase